MTIDIRRPKGRLFYCLISLVVCVSAARAQSPALTTITDTIYRADGTPAAGQLVITWPAFTTAANRAVAAGEKTLALGAGGALSTLLAPNEGATPAGSYYKVIYKLGDGTTATEYWTVPISTPTTVGLIRATVVPSQVAAQLVTRQYVDNVLGAADIVHKASAETITGAKTFGLSPSVPTPSENNDAANKSYVDAQVGTSADIVHRTGAETVTGAKTFSISPMLPMPSGANDAANKSYVDTQLGVIAPNGTRIGNVRQAHLFPGANAGAKINACIADLPPTGGTCDARGFEGAQAITTSVVVDRPTVLMLGASVFQLSGAGELAVTSSLRVLGTLQTTNNVSTGTIVQISRAGCAFRFPLGPSSKVEQFELGDFQVQGGGGSFDNCLVDVPSNVGGSFDGNQSRWFFHDLWVANLGNASSTKAALNFGDSIYWLSFERNIFSNNAGGDINAGYADDMNVSHNFFWTLAQNNPHIRLVGGTSTHISQNEFENGTNSPQPDILLKTEANMQRGYVHILENKFGPEAEGGRQYKVRAYSASFPSAPIATVWFQQNEVFGASSANPIAYAIQLDNPTPRWIIKDNNFYNVSTIVNDNVGLINADVSNSILRDNVIAPPTSGTTLFANGGRSFSIADRAIGTPDRPFNNLVKLTETPELRNRLAYSEALDNATWVKSAAITAATAQSDPYGSTRAVRLNNDGTATFANLHAPLDITGLGNRVTVRFWAKAGSLDRLDVGIFDTFSTPTPSGGVLQLKLSSAWQEYKLTFAIVTPAHTHDLYIYVGDRTLTNSGNLYVFGVQVSDYDSDYVKTAGAAFADTNFGARFERKVEFARDIVVAGVTTNPSTDEWLHENWCGGLATNGQIGTLGWRTAGFGSGIAGFDSYGATAGVGGGCAIQFRQAASTAGAGLIVFLGGPDGTAQSQFNASPWWVQSSINLETTASETVRFGKSSALVETGSDAAYIRYIGGTDTQFMCEVIKAGVVTTSGTGVTPTANTWYKTRIERDASGNITCTVNSSSATVNAANAPGAVGVFDIFEVKSLTAAQWRLRSRYYEQHWTGLTR